MEKKRLERFLQNSDKAAWLRKEKDYSQVDVFNRLRSFARFRDKKRSPHTGSIDSFREGITLHISSISRADLRGIDFSGLVLHGVHFEDVNFDGAKFKGGSFDCVHFERCSFKGADMRDMSRFLINGVFGDFEGADLRGTRFNNRIGSIDSIRLLLSNDRLVRFSGTKITPEQNDFLSGFDIPDGQILRRFEIVPR